MSGEPPPGQFKDLSRSEGLFILGQQHTASQVLRRLPRVLGRRVSSPMNQVVYATRLPYELVIEHRLGLVDVVRGPRDRSRLCRRSRSHHVRA